MLGYQALHSLRLRSRTLESGHKVLFVITHSAFQVEGMLRGYHGTLCSDCLPGYRAAQKGCQQCTDLETISSKRMVPGTRFKKSSFHAKHANVAPQDLWVTRPMTMYFDTGEFGNVSSPRLCDKTVSRPTRG